MRLISVLYSSMYFDKGIMLYICHYNIIQNSFTALKITCAQPAHTYFPLAKSLATTDHFPVSMIVLLPECLE